MTNTKYLLLLYLHVCDPVHHQFEYVVVHITCRSSIKDPAKRATQVKEYVTAMKTVKQHNMVNREMKLAIGDEVQIVNANKQVAEETRKELAPMKISMELWQHNMLMLDHHQVKLLLLQESWATKYGKQSSTIRWK